MANGLKIISEKDFLNANDDTARGWTHRILTSIYEQNEDIAKKVNTIVDIQKSCPGRNYRPIVDKIIVGACGLVGGFLAVIVALKTKIIETVTHIQ